MVETTTVIISQVDNTRADSSAVGSGLRGPTDVYVIVVSESGGGGTTVPPSATAAGVNKVTLKTQMVSTNRVQASTFLIVNFLKHINASSEKGFRFV